MGVVEYKASAESRGPEAGQVDIRCVNGMPVASSQYQVLIESLELVVQSFEYHATRLLNEARDREPRGPRLLVAYAALEIWSLRNVIRKFTSSRTVPFCS